MTRSTQRHAQFGVGRLAGGLTAASILMLVVSCADLGDGRPKIDSNSNWLAMCAADGDCEGDAVCICGVCTLSCDAADACGDLADAVCRQVDSVSVDALCGEVGPPEAPVCLPECASAEGCDEGQTCVGGACVVTADDRFQALCGETGGDWDEISCGHWTCGDEPACDAIIPGCNCGPNMTFDLEQGCRIDPDCTGRSEDELLCAETRGAWDPLSCGHYTCGAPPLCEAIIPGCDCGEGRSFESGEGCVEDGTCSEPSDAEVCEETGGAWDETSCGHYFCGQHPACEAIIPGCDCGEGQNFEPGEGCVEDAACSERTDRAICEETDGIWREESCGHWECGELRRVCVRNEPGCDCGLGRNFADGEGCFDDATCTAPSDEALCRETDGEWDPLSCGHYLCGHFPECDAIVPGCNCGEGRSFVNDEGCLDDDTCAVPGDQVLCEDTEGRWDELSCGHYTCGSPPLCEAIIPGCDCGEGRTFVEGEGCAVDDACPSSDDAILCADTGGAWHPEDCGHYYCGLQRDCPPLSATPGCDCGSERNFVDGEGCVVDLDCIDLIEQGLCLETAGTWRESSCGHWICGVEPPILCFRNDPGCDCGRESNYVEGVGCVRDEACLVSPDQALCEETAGIWDVGSCGHYLCGAFPACDAVIPGCNCGAERNFVEGEGCLLDEVCL